MDDTVRLRLDALPLVRSADFAVTHRPFVHQSRTLDYHVLVYILKGGMHIIEEGAPYELGPGELLLLKAGLHHWGERACPAGTTWIYIHFHLQDADGAPPFSPYAGFMRNREFDPADYQCALPLPKTRRYALGGPLEGKLQALVDLYHASDPLRAGQINAQLCQLLVDVYRGGEDAPPAEGNRTLRLIRYLEERMCEPFDARGIEAEMGLSYKYLNELFQRETGMTALRYHTGLRMNEAARLLRETSLSVTEIGERLGYVNVFYFSNVFKKVNGVPPRDYARNYVGR